MPQDARARLQELRADAAARVTTIDDALEALQHDRSSLSDDDEHDPEGVPLSAEWSRLQGLAEAARSELAQVEGALVRLDDGRYGVCTRCGQPIPAARLEVRPFAELCVPCAEKQR
ncbi:TraR/DksA family transcriptional regulator [Microbacterium aurantiacum]|uniref:TraR/DksA family transcriptional regulator n=1 Tax=Microbacterium aurantiacum TaxID=162393 RepID=UPI000C80BA6C|nr:TraR/DksA C4-type zinc finger protein [Microbacterium aurantiacum]